MKNEFDVERRRTTLSDTNRIDPICDGASDSEGVVRHEIHFSCI
jgi:hypothetical protein